MQLRFISITIVTALLTGINSIFPGPTSAQTSMNDKLTVYVWEFSTQNNDEKTIANRLTEDFETEVINSRIYQVIEIRELSRVEEQRELQELIFDVAELSDQQIDRLQQNLAEAVFFGKLIYDKGNQQYIIETKLQHLDGRILRKKSLIINHADLLRNEDRRQHMKKLFYQLHEERFKARKKEQYDLISTRLNEFLMCAKDLSTQMRRVELLLEMPEYLEDYTACMARYDQSIKDLIENQTKYESDFREVWGSEAGEALSEVFFTIIQDFHTPYVFKEMNKLNESIAVYWKTPTNRGRKDLQNDVLKSRDMLQNGLDNHLGKVSQSIAVFLNEMNAKL